MINKNSLMHITTGIKIYKAIREAVKLSKQRGGRASTYVLNNKGEPFLRVTYSTWDSFTFWSNDQVDVTNIVKSALQA